MLIDEFYYPEFDCFDTYKSNIFDDSLRFTPNNDDFSTLGFNFVNQPSHEETITSTMNQRKMIQGKNGVILIPPTMPIRPAAPLVAIKHEKHETNGTKRTIDHLQNKIDSESALKYARFESETGEGDDVKVERR